MELTERQRSELEYHQQHARKKQQLLTEPFSWDVLDRPCRRWWNAYWSMYAHLVRLEMAGKTVLVVGCGYGKDALRLAKLGATVHAFDLSPDLLSIARALAKREGLRVFFDEMPAESLTYDDNCFDVGVLSASVRELILRGWYAESCSCNSFWRTADAYEEKRCEAGGGPAAV